jgi:peptidyl-prolyl cis-trans isomerase C
MNRPSSGFILATLLLAACAQGAAPNAAEVGSVVAIVNGKPILKSEFDLYVQNIGQQAQREVTEAQKAEILDQYIALKLAADTAEKAGVAKQQNVVDQLSIARLNVVVDAGLQKYLEDHPVTDAELKPEYDAQVAALPREYHARHILLEDKATAETVTKDLQGGGDFAKLAKEKSKDTSAQSGGDLGWFTLDTMVKPFADALTALQPGQLTAEPVQSQFGWHVIKLEDSRAAAPPAFDEVKDRVKTIVQRKKLQAYLDELRKSAKIEKKI